MFQTNKKVKTNEKVENEVANLMFFYILKFFTNIEKKIVLFLIKLFFSPFTHFAVTIYMSVI